MVMNYKWTDERKAANYLSTPEALVIIKQAGLSAGEIDSKFKLPDADVPDVIYVVNKIRGWDVPSCAFLFSLRELTFDSGFAQFLGRVLRSFPGADTCHVIFVEESETHKCMKRWIATQVMNETLDPVPATLKIETEDEEEKEEGDERKPIQVLTTVSRFFIGETTDVVIVPRALPPLSFAISAPASSSSSAPVAPSAAASSSSSSSAPIAPSASSSSTARVDEKAPSLSTSRVEEEIAAVKANQVGFFKAFLNENVPSMPFSFRDAARMFRKKYPWTEDEHQWSRVLNGPTSQSFPYVMTHRIDSWIQSCKRHFHVDDSKKLFLGAKPLDSKPLKRLKKAVAVDDDEDIDEDLDVPATRSTKPKRIVVRDDDMDEDMDVASPSADNQASEIAEMKANQAKFFVAFLKSMEAKGRLPLSYRDARQAFLDAYPWLKNEATYNQLLAEPSTEPFPKCMHHRLASLVQQAKRAFEVDDDKLQILRSRTSSKRKPKSSSGVRSPSAQPLKRRKSLKPGNSEKSKSK